MSRPTREQVLAWAAALTPLAVSLAGNVTWGWTTGSPILIAAGIVTPLLLVLAIERWRSMPTATGVQWWVRTIAMGGVVVVVAGWSWLHTTALLLDEVEALHPAPPVGVADTILRAAEVVLCVLAPLAVDGLAVLSVLALDAGRAAVINADADGDEGDDQGSDASRGDGADRSDERADRSDDARTGPDRRSDAELLEVLRAVDPVPSTRNAVMREAAVGTGRADRLLAALTSADRPDRDAPDRSGPRRNGHPVGASPGG